MEIIYRKVEKNEKEQLFTFIDDILSRIKDCNYFIPYDQWELDNMFDEENYGYVYGAFDTNKLVGMSQLYVNQQMLAECKQLLSIDEDSCEIGGNLVLEEYRDKSIATNLMKNEIELAKQLGFKTIIAMAHPDNKASIKSLEHVGFSFVKEETLNNGFKRNLYCLKVK